MKAEHDAGHDKVAVVTGASSGVGKEAAKGLASLGYTIIALGRNKERCDAARQEIVASATNPDKVTMLRADFSLLAETAQAAKSILQLTPHVDLLINNAGGVSDGMRITDEGFEQTFTSNYLSPFLFTQLLLPTMIESAEDSSEAKVRVLSTSSIGHHSCPGINFDDLQWTENYSTGGAYTNAKLGNVLFTRELAKRYGDKGIVAHAMEPGVVLESNFINHADQTMQAYMNTLNDEAVTAAHAAETLIWMATDKDLGLQNGQYFAELKPAAISEAAQDNAAASRLWETSLSLVDAYL